eukprot:gene2611-4843_t
MSAYTAIVKDNYQKAKQDTPNSNSKDILRLVAEQWQRQKPPKVAP